MNTRSEYDENRVAVDESLQAGHDILSYLSPRFATNNIGGSTMTGNQGANRLGIASLLQKQKEHDEQQLLVSRLLLHRQQEQQTEALLAASRIPNSSATVPHSLVVGGAHTRSLFADTLGKRNSDLDSLLQREQLNQQIKLLRVEAEITRRSQAAQSQNEMPGHKIQASAYQSNLDNEDIKKPESTSDVVKPVKKESKEEVDGPRAAKNNVIEEGGNESFPRKVYRMLEEAEENGMEDVASFLSHGRVFVIHKPRKFITDFMPKYFSTSRMSSFQRQLNLYGFRRVKGGADKGGYYHDSFLKGKPELLVRIKRKKPRVKKPTLSGANGEALGCMGGIAGGVLDNSTGLNQYDVNMLQTSMKSFPRISSLGSRMMPMGLNGIPESAFRRPLSTGIQPIEQSAETVALLLSQIQEKEQERERLIAEMRRSRLDP